MTRQHPIRRAAIFGASGGIGAAMVELLAADPNCERIYAGSRTRKSTTDPRITPFAFDLTDEGSIAAAAAMITAHGSLDFVFVATGILHDGAVYGPEKATRALNPAHMAQILAINTIGPAIIAKHLVPLLPRRERGVFAALSARVGSISDNRLGGWHSYRASKAALNMLVRTIAIEAAQRQPESVIVTLHPGTVDTRLSASFQRGVAPEKLFTPSMSAASLLSVVDTLAPADSGGLFAWDGERLPY